MKSAIASSADSSSPSESTISSAGSASITACHVVAESMSSNSARRLGAEHVDEPRIELRPAALAGDRHRRLHASFAVVDLDHVGERHQARRACRICSPAASAGTPLPSQRSNVW